jgi:hypothetical protein
MAKRSKRRSKRRVAAQRPAAVVEKRREVSTPAPKAPAPKGAALRAPVSHAIDLANEYRYVYGDLKRIGVLAVAMLGLLAALALAAQTVF